MSDDDTQVGQGGHIEANLKRVYQEVLEEDVPDRFINLLNQLKSQTEDDTGEQSK